ncbi:MAG: hypothetical protein MUQ65_03790 [Armatimonadetes bacterium]|nr:hypothetical protein [Armatimonadota bacterium]
MTFALIFPHLPLAPFRAGLRDFEEKRPSFIVVAHNDVLPWMTGRRDDSAAQVRSFGEFQGLLDRRYRTVQRIEDFDIYERRDRQSDR